jgi:hypothetical protein
MVGSGWGCREVGLVGSRLQLGCNSKERVKEEGEEEKEEGIKGRTEGKRQ